MMLNNTGGRLSILLQWTGLLLSAWLLTGCATSGLKCIQAEGEWGHDDYGFEGREIKRDGPIDHFVTLDCRGTYSLSIAVEPDDRFVFGEGIIEGRRNSYYEEVELADGTSIEKLLQPYTVHYTIEVSSLDKPGKVVVTRVKRRLGPSWEVYGLKLLTIPKDFFPGEQLRIRMLISAEDDFYRDYGLLKMGLIKDFRIH